MHCVGRRRGVPSPRGAPTWGQATASVRSRVVTVCMPGWGARLSSLWGRHPASPASLPVRRPGVLRVKGGRSHKANAFLEEKRNSRVAPFTPAHFLLPAWSPLCPESRPQAVFREGPRQPAPGQAPPSPSTFLCPHSGLALPDDARRHLTCCVRVLI